ncbi:hypothetical protein FV971_09150 [Campylobacter coli]|nr:hypothetical protein [Campylobacter coli]
MGYRCHIATHYEVKYTGGYFNNSENELLELLEKVELAVLYLNLEDYDLNEDEKDFLKDLIEVAKTAPYAKNSGIIRLSWF